MRKYAIWFGRSRWGLLLIVVCAAAISAAAIAQEVQQSSNPQVSPVRKIDQPPDRANRDSPRPPAPLLFRSIDGSGNNLRQPEMGATFTALRRSMDSDYEDGISEMAGAERPGAREVSNIVCGQSESILNPFAASDFLWQWGQFVDHDIDLTEGADPPEPANILVPSGDPFFDPQGTGLAEIAFNRSLYDVETGTDPDNPRQQMNEITAWIDGSQVYGSDEERALELRTMDGTGRLKTSPGNLLPFNQAGLPNAGGSSPELFLAGDVRANEQVGLTAMHTLFVREHNRLSANLRNQHRKWTGEMIYQRARQMVGALIQAITYREYLNALLGPGALEPYRGYRPKTDGGITNEFSTAAYRYGHSALSATLLRLDRFGHEIPEGNLDLRDAFFSPQRITQEGGIEPLLRGLAYQVCQRVDTYVVDDVRNFLFGPPGAGGFDLASLNIQRGRDHGMPGYNQARERLGLARKQNFDQLTSDPALRERLALAYGTVDDIDLWVGGLAEDPLQGSHVGEVMFRIIKRQFEALRDGDRFWYQRIYDGKELREIESTRLADIIRRNTDIRDEIPNNVFRVEPCRVNPRGCRP